MSTLRTLGRIRNNFRKKKKCREKFIYFKNCLEICVSVCFPYLICGGWTEGLKREMLLKW